MSDRLPAYFISHVRAAVGGYMLFLAAVGDRHFDYYPAAAWWLTLVAVGYALVILVVLHQPWRRAISGRVTWVLTAVDTGIITVLAGLTGGAQSPFAPILLLVVIAVAIRFGLRRAVVALGWTAPLLAGLILVVPQPDRPLDQRVRDALWWTGHLTAGAVLAGVLSDRLDLAHRRRAQAESQAEMEHERLEMERLLRRRLEDLDQARREFLASLLCEFRPSVVSLSTLSRALRRDGGELAPEERAGILERVEVSAQHLDAVLGEVGEVLVSESLGVEHSRQYADVYLPQLAGQAAAMSGLPLERLTTRVDPGLVVVRADPDKVLRILAKLLEDAIRASPPAEPVEVEVRRRDDDVELCVLDRRRAARARREPGSTPSLGLWVASRLAEGMGGGVVTEPRDGGGLAVRAWFPAVRPASPAGPPSSGTSVVGSEGAPSRP